MDNGFQTESCTDQSSYNDRLTITNHCSISSSKSNNTCYSFSNMNEDELKEEIQNEIRCFCKKLTDDGVPFELAGNCRCQNSENDVPPYQSSSSSCQIENINSVPFSNTSSTNCISNKQPPTTRLFILMTEVSRLILPTVISIYYALIRNQKIIVEKLRRRLLPALVAFLANNLSRTLPSVRRQSTRQLSENPPELIISQPSSSNIGFERSVSCEVIVEPDSTHRADVIFIHGLHGSLNKTWRQGTWNEKSVENNVKYVRQKNDRKRKLPSGSTCPMKKATMNSEVDDVEDCKVEDEVEDVSKCWPKDWLPSDCPGVRVIALNYTTDPYLWRPVWIKQRKRTSLELRAQEMIELLLEKNVGARPIIWVAHSKGGLFVKQLIINAWETKTNQQFDNLDEMDSLKMTSQLSSSLEGFYKQSKGVMFYSVPHLGSPLADMNLPLLRQSIELQEIRKDSPLLIDLHRKFLQLCETEDFNPEIFSFIETSLTLMSIVYLKIVPFESADPGVGTICGVPIDHRDICKPTSRDCFLYQELAELINRVL